MTDLHPNWQATDMSADEQPLPVRIAQKSDSHPQPAPRLSNPQHAHRLSRQPAAVAGMLVVISIGLTLFFGKDGGRQTTIRITENGFIPKSSIVNKGKEIRWVNETTRPHVLQSDALCATGQECFSTHSIAPGESVTLTITSDFRSGTYPYYSISAQDMEASITVQSDTDKIAPSAARGATQQHLAQAAVLDANQSSAQFSSAADVTSDVTLSNVMAFSLPPEDEDSSAHLADTQSNDESSATEESNQGTDWESIMRADAFSSSSLDGLPKQPSQAAQIPINPYTVNSTRTHPFDAQGKPAAGGSSSSAGKNALHGGAHRPLTQPTTGPGIWVTLAGSIGLLFLCTRKLLRREFV